MITTDESSRAVRDPSIVLASAVGLLVGVATSWGQGLLGSSPFAGLANGASPWLVAPFMIGSSARSRRRAAFLGLVTCVAEVLGYYLTAAVRGFGINPMMVAIWVAAGVVGGVVFGWAGASWKWGDGWERGLGAALLIAVWICEAVRYVIVLDYVGEGVTFVGVAVTLWVLLGLSGRQHLRILTWLPVAAALGVAGGSVMLRFL